jgi:hypothetical protein
VYAFASWLSLKFFDSSVYFDAVRNCYEGERLVWFLAEHILILIDVASFRYLQLSIIMFRVSWWRSCCCPRSHRSDLNLSWSLVFLEALELPTMRPLLRPVP